MCILNKITPQMDFLIFHPLKFFLCSIHSTLLLPAIEFIIIIYIFSRESSSLNNYKCLSIWQSICQSTGWLIYFFLFRSACMELFCQLLMVKLAFLCSTLWAISIPKRNLPPKMNIFAYMGTPKILGFSNILQY